MKEIYMRQHLVSMKATKGRRREVSEELRTPKNA
jgi:hypothetical protein